MFAWKRVALSTVLIMISAVCDSSLTEVPQPASGFKISETVCKGSDFKVKKIMK